MCLYKSHSLTRLTPVIKTRLLLKLPNVDKNRLDARHTFKTKTNVFLFEKNVRVRLTFNHFLFLFAAFTNQWLFTNHLLLLASNTFLTSDKLVIVNHQDNNIRKRRKNLEHVNLLPLVVS
jgi:hypothetical protein